MAARGHATNAAFHAERESYAAACQEATRASVRAKAALSHSCLLPTEYFSEDHTYTAWVPLILPAIPAVGAAFVTAVGKRIWKVRAWRAPPHTPGRLAPFKGSRPGG